VHLPTHALIGWVFAEAIPLERRDRILVFLAGVAPDLDGLTLLFGKEVYQAWHHVLLHHGTAAVVYAIIALALARRRLVTGALALAGFHIHLLGDFVGSAGPDGSLWSVPYLVPFDLWLRGGVRDFYCPWQWELASWQNVVATVVAILFCAHFGAVRGRTVVEVLSRRADAAVVEVLKRRWPLARR
jgi:hypothetical protein